MDYLPENCVGICPCGYPLVPQCDAHGNRIGVTHETQEMDDHHFRFFCGMSVRIPEEDRSDGDGIQIYDD